MGEELEGLSSLPTYGVELERRGGRYPVGAHDGSVLACGEDCAVLLASFDEEHERCTAKVGSGGRGRAYEAPRSAGGRSLPIALRRWDGEDFELRAQRRSAGASRPRKGEFRSRLRRPSIAGNPGAQRRGASSKRPGPPEPTFAQWRSFSSSRATSATARRAVPAGGDLWVGEERSGEGRRAPQVRASCSDSPTLFERSGRRPRSEFGGATLDASTTAQSSPQARTDPV